ncbi:MAG: hypothetical protein B6244_14510 [Candidatus Cloacimonetes bacterium 4572_55]|nr:MAG: hypothetical protein B6244_14510 [Candidatus Cloacimonetes bacterium 4572_55]
MAYSVDANLQKIRSTIMELGVSDWSDFHDLAATAIDDDLEVKWYRKASNAMGYDWRHTRFDSSLLLNSASQLLNLSCYKTFFLIYRYLAQDTTTELDAYGQQRNYWAKQYDDELIRVVEIGLDYDWNSSGSIDDYEKAVKRPVRRIKRV